MNEEAEAEVSVGELLFFLSLVLLEELQMLADTPMMVCGC